MSKSKKCSVSVARDITFILSIKGCLKVSGKVLKIINYYAENWEEGTRRYRATLLGVFNETVTKKRPDPINWLTRQGIGLISQNKFQLGHVK